MAHLQIIARRSRGAAGWRRPAGLKMVPASCMGAQTACRRRQDGDGPSLCEAAPHRLARAWDPRPVSTLPPAGAWKSNQVGIKMETNTERTTNSCCYRAPPTSFGHFKPHPADAIARRLHYSAEPGRVRIIMMGSRGAGLWWPPPPSPRRRATYIAPLAWWSSAPAGPSRSARSGR
jgi:hypothetical protein